MAEHKKKEHEEKFVELEPVKEIEIQTKDIITLPTIIIVMPDILSEVHHLQSGLS